MLQVIDFFFNKIRHPLLFVVQYKKPIKSEQKNRIEKKAKYLKNKSLQNKFRTDNELWLGIHLFCPLA